MQKLKAAVIGLGEMGQHHARVYAQMPDVDLVAVCDSDPQRLQSITRTWGGRPFSDFCRLLDEAQPDLVSVAVPTSAHFEVASLVLDAGAHTLVEKPIAASIIQAQTLLAMASIKSRILAVGHIERCNPIVTATKAILDAGDLGEVYRITTRRVGPSPKRIRDVGCTLDLLTHDLDVACYLLQSEPLFVQSELQHQAHDSFDDGVAALVRFENGVIGMFEADWLSAAKDRRLTITGSLGVWEADYLRQTAVMRASPTAQVKFDVPKEEPLLVELRSFVAAVRGEGRPAATGEDGLRALEMAMRILEGDHGSCVCSGNCRACISNDACDC